MTVFQAIQWSCVVVFCVTAVVTFAGLTGLWKLGGGSAEDHKYYLKRLFHALIVEIVVVSVAGFSAYVKAAAASPLAIVPPSPTVPTPDLPPEADAGFVLLRDISMWDLRGRVEIPANRGGDRVSPAHYINYLHLKKTAAVGKYVAHYQTGGSGIDLRCITHSAKIYEKTNPTVHESGHEYAVEVDVSADAVGQEFLLVIEGTYWNGFQGSTGDVETYTDSDTSALGELAIFVLFPESNHIKGQPQLTEIDSNSKQERQIRESTQLFRDSSGQFVYWNVTSRRPNKHYRIGWEW